jgi:hypothetical protein
MSAIQAEEMRHWERNLEDMVNAGTMQPDQAAEMLRNKQMELAMRGGV